jgi:hypothetical protein
MNQLLCPKVLIPHIKWIKPAIQFINSDTFYGTTPLLTLRKHFLGLLQIKSPCPQKPPVAMDSICCVTVAQDDGRLTIAFRHLYQPSHQREEFHRRTTLFEALAEPGCGPGSSGSQEKKFMKDRKRITRCRREN